MKLTLLLQSEMQIKIDNNIIEIDIPIECKRDLWKGQIECWLKENDGKFNCAGFLRVENNNKLKFSK